MFELLIIIFLILLNGIFALSELAIISSRPARLNAMIESGRHGSLRALALASDPGRFLSTVQIGITLIGILSGTFSGITYGEHLTIWLSARGVTEQIAEPLGFGVVIAVITYFSIIIGELVPKQLALRNAEKIACAVAPFMMIVSRISTPIVWLLDKSSRLIFWIMGQKPEAENKVTEEEIKMLVAEAESFGVLEASEQRMISGVLRLGSRPVRGVMTPRPEVEWIDLSASENELRNHFINAAHSWLPAGQGSVDKMIGVIDVREALADMARKSPFNIQKLVHQAPMMPEKAEALDALGILKSAKIPMALVHDEHGQFQGVVTPADILQTIAGDFLSSSRETSEPAAVRRQDGSWLFSGWIPADEMADILGINLPKKRDYQTLAGFLMAQMGVIPATGTICNANGWRFEIVDMDGVRINKVLASRHTPTHRVGR
ncbi:MAG: HlyC/CorC family transporter [Deltaproteobacteria bacterium]|nr:HlyC/CorC family transporter [Deltaproteobacteria bacterium]